jgi:hypothetical protein
MRNKDDYTTIMVSKKLKKEIDMVMSQNNHKTYTEVLKTYVKQNEKSIEPDYVNYFTDYEIDF